jgi:hypothetical protein
MVHLVVVLALVGAGTAQNDSGSGNSISPTQITLPLLTSPLPVTSVNIQLVGNPGPSTLYFWIVANSLIGSASPGGPFILQQAPIALSVSNYAALSWQPVQSAVSYDVLLTSSPTPPSGACNCALATGLNGTTYNAQTNGTSAYTVGSVDPSQFAITEQNVPSANGVSQWQWVLPNGKILCSLDTTGLLSCGGSGIQGSGIYNAGDFPGADPCIKYAAAESVAPASSTILVPAGTCTGTLNMTKAGIQMQLNNSGLVLDGCPGINITAPGVAIVGQPGVPPYQSTAATRLVSGSACPLIQNPVTALHGADGTTLKNVYLAGNSIGTFGTLFASNASVDIEHVGASGFTSTALFTPGLQGSYDDIVVFSSGGDAMVVGGDSIKMVGLEIDGSTNGDCIHAVAGGNVYDAPITYECGLHGIHPDSNLGGDFVPSFTYVEQKIILPLTGNPGNYAYYVMVPGTVAASPPVWCQTFACTMASGTATLINIGTMHGYTASPDFGSNNWNSFISPNLSQAGQANAGGGPWCDLFIEGTNARYAFQTTITDPAIRQTQASNPQSYPAAGICLSHVSHLKLSGYEWWGNGLTGYNQNDLGALIADSWFYLRVSDMDSYGSWGPPVTLTNGRDAQFSDSDIIDTGNNGDSICGVGIASSAIDVHFRGLAISDDRTPPYSMGFCNSAGNDHNITVSGYNPTGLVTNPDSWGNTVVLDTPGIVQGSGIQGGIAFASFPNPVAGSNFKCRDCAPTAPATCNAGNLADCVCASSPGTPGWAHAVDNTRWLCGGQ